MSEGSTAGRVASDIRYLMRVTQVGRGQLCVILLLSVASSFLSLVPIQFLAALSKLGGMQRDVWLRLLPPGLSPSGEQVALVLYSGGCAIMASVLRNVFAAMASNVASNGVARLKIAGTDTVLGRPWYQVRERGEDVLAESIAHDPEGIHSVFSQPLFTLVSDLFDMVFIILLCFSLGWQLPALLVLSVPAMLWLARVVSRRQYSLMRRARDSSVAADSFLTAMLRNLELVISFGRHFPTLHEVSARCETARKAEVRANWELGAFFTMQGAAQTIVTLLAVWLAVKDAPSWAVAAANALLLTQYCSRFFRPMSTLVGQVQSVARGWVSVQRILSVLRMVEQDIQSTICIPDLGSDVSPRLGTVPPAVELADFAVVANGTQVLVRCDSLNVFGGGLVAITGPSGSGKSSLLRGLQGHLESSGGAWIGETELKQLLSSEGNHGIFSLGTNEVWNSGLSATQALELGSHLPMDQACVVRLAKELNMQKVLADPDYPASALSAGELRRLSLIRCIAAPRPVTLMDELDSNVDAKTREAMYSIVNTELRGRSTVLWVTHNLSLDDLHPDVVIRIKENASLNPRT